MNTRPTHAVWFRPQRGQPWQLLYRGIGHEAVYSRAVELLDEQGLTGGELQCLPVGQVPIVPRRDAAFPQVAEP